MVIQNQNQYLQELDTIFSGSRLHHAYLIEGKISVGTELKNRIAHKLGVDVHNNPDFLHIHTEVLTIDDARRVGEAQATKALSASPYKIFLIETTAITVEAQNALLKTLEEPTASTLFFLILPSRWLLLPTVLSRLHVVQMTSGIEERASVSAEVFWAATPAERLKHIEPLLEKKDKKEALVFIDSLIRYAHQTPGSQKYVALQELLHARGYLMDRAASLKLILEHLALSIPPLL